jgi:hypothetical protein
MHDNPSVADCVETLCHKGCRQVWREIAALERGQDLPETLDLTLDERAEVLEELRDIMAVYGDRCAVD